MSIRDEQLERISNALNKPINEVSTNRKALKSPALNKITEELGLKNGVEYFTAAEARTKISEEIGENQYYTGKQRFGWEKLRDVADTLHNL